MSFAAVVDRVRGEFVEMPGLELTLAQAVRLWTLGADDCRYVIDSLVDVGFLKWTSRRTIVRTGLDLPVGRDAEPPSRAKRASASHAEAFGEGGTADIPVRRLGRHNKSV
jgi:hypothetical protein